MIGILGTTGYIGRSLARHIDQAAGAPLVLFARDPSRLAGDWSKSVRLAALEDFDAGGFELVINAIGAGDPARVKSMGASLLDISHHWDSRVLDTMGADTRYVFLSSGAIYGSFGAAAEADSELRLAVNRLGDAPPYLISKLYAEARHRYLAERAILDLRVFSYADEGIDRAGAFFLAELARAVAQRTPLRTTPADMVRDYAGAPELWALIDGWRNAGAPNIAADLYSAAPVSKSELLSAAQERYGLAVETAALAPESPTGAKSIYASNNRAASGFGYAPRRTSREIVLDMLDRVRAGDAR